MRELDSVKKFAQTSPDLYNMFKDCSNQMLSAERNMTTLSFSSEKSLDEKEKAINKAFAAELARRSKLTIEDYEGDVAHYAANSTVLSFADSIIDNMIDMVLPNVLNSSVGMIADIRYTGWGDSQKFDLESNALFNVSKAGKRQRNTLAQRTEDTTYTLVPEGHEVTVITNLYQILTGRDSLARLVMRIVKSIEADIANQAWDAFITAVSATTTPAAFKVTNFSEASAITLAETVTAYNGGRKAIFAGTPLALKSILPTNANYRYSLDDAMVKMGYIPTFNTYDVLPMPQFADYKSNNYSLKLPNNKIFVVSPSADKIIKVVVGGTLSHTEEGYFNANLAQVGTIYKEYAAAAITNSVAGVITLGS